MDSSSRSSCVLCDVHCPEKPKRFYQQDTQFVIIDSTLTYAPVLIGGHGIEIPGLHWFTAIKAIAAKLYGKDYTLSSGRKHEHFLIEVIPVNRTRDLSFKP